MALVVERPTISLDIVEPDVVRTTRVGPGEEQNCRRYSCVGTEGSAGQRDHCVEVLLLDQQAAQFLVSLARTEEHTIRHDNRARPPGFSRRMKRARKSSSVFLV